MGARNRFVGVATLVLPMLFFASPALGQTAEREVVVHLEADSGVTLERDDGADHWTEVCFAPCDLSFSTRAHYRVGGGIRDSKPFTLHQTSPGLEVIVVEPRSRGVHAFGDVLIGIGSAMTFAGVFSVMLGAIAAHCPDGAGRGDSCGGTDNELLVPGIALAIAGIGPIILGVDLVVVNSASYAQPKHVKKDRDDANRAHAMLFDLSRRRADLWTLSLFSLMGPLLLQHQGTRESSERPGIKMDRNDAARQGASAAWFRLARLFGNGRV